MLTVLAALLSPAFHHETIKQAAQYCVPQPLPPAIDAAGEPPLASNMIEFAATPSLEYPGRAWVVRLSMRINTEATVEIMRLRQQRDCNRYDVEARWQAPLRQEEYIALAEKVVSVGLPSSTTFVPAPASRLPNLVLDGTSIMLRFRSTGWQVTHSLNEYGQGGAETSAIFEEIVSKYVPFDERPAEGWRTPNSQRGSSVDHHAY